MEPMNDTKTRLQKIDKVRKELYPATRRLSWHNESRMWERSIEIMMPGGGYCFAPTHQIQDNSPTENVVAMCETARQDGTY